MKIPRYIQEILLRSNFVRGYGNPGYQIQIHKSSDYQCVGTLMEDSKKLVEWSRKQYKKMCCCDCSNEDAEQIAFVQKLLTKTKHSDQCSEVVIFDPVMKNLEPYILQSRFEKQERLFL